MDTGSRQETRRCKSCEAFHSLACRWYIRSRQKLWRKVKESNHQRFRWPGFRDRLLAAERHLPLVGRRGVIRTPGLTVRNRVLWSG
jgi:hypothetical protein